MGQADSVAIGGGKRRLMSDTPKEVEIDFDDPRFHKRTIHWGPLIRDGISVKDVLRQAQKRRLFRIARSASVRIENERRKKAADNDSS